MNLINFLDCTCAGKDIPTQLADIVQLIYKAIQIGVPVILIIVGMFDMGKAITQQKEDEIKKAQSLLVKKAIAAGLVFLMFSMVTLVLSVVGGNDASNTSCIRCLLIGEGETEEEPTNPTLANVQNWPTEEVTSINENTCQVDMVNKKIIYNCSTATPTPTPTESSTGFECTCQ